MKKLLYLALTLIALVLIYVRLRYAEPSTNPSPSPSPTISTAVSPSPSPTLTKTLDNDYFSLNYAPEATVSTRPAPDSFDWVISYLGEEQRSSGRTQTELWDGYSFVLTRFEATGDDPAQAQAEADRAGTVEACGAENATEIKPTQISTLTALTYTGGCLGSADHYYVMVADTLYRLAVMTVGSDKYLSTYHAITQAMLSSLRFK